MWKPLMIGLAPEAVLVQPSATRVPSTVGDQAVLVGRHEAQRFVPKLVTDRGDWSNTAIDHTVRAYLGHVCELSLVSIASLADTIF